MQMKGSVLFDCRGHDPFEVCMHRHSEGIKACYQGQYLDTHRGRTQLTVELVERIITRIYMQTSVRVECILGNYKLVISLLK